MVVLVVGPSGAGKTTAVEVVGRKSPSWAVAILDDAAAELARARGMIDRPCIHLLRKTIDHRQFLAFGLEVIEDLAARNSGRRVLIDVGAGFQDAPDAARALATYSAITLHCDARIAFERCKQQRGEGRPFAEYLRAEFRPERQKIYAGSRHSIDTTQLDPSQVADRLAGLLDGVALH